MMKLFSQFLIPSLALCSTFGTLFSEASSSGSDSSDEYHMTTVTAIHTRADSSAPTWNEEYQVWVADYYDTFEENYRDVLDTVNTASVEGALMYVQAECINVQEQSVECERKNEVQYIWFYEIEMVATNASLAQYENESTYYYEYTPYMSMDDGACTNVSNGISAQCKEVNGIDGYSDLGPTVGAADESDQLRAPYDGSIWYSFPNSCVYKSWDDKTESCREEYPGGLCDFNTTPDGVTCTFSYKVLGYIDLDDVVGITSMTNNETGEYYSNYTEFCEAGGIEFSATDDSTEGFIDVTSISFWEDPSNTTANAERITQLVELYNTQTENSSLNMESIPSISTLNASNPACYLNSKICSEATYGCKRVNYSQVCVKCSSAESGCVVAPDDWTYPTLSVVSNNSNAATSSGSGSNGAMSLSTSIATVGLGLVATIFML